MFVSINLNILFNLKKGLISLGKRFNFNCKRYYSICKRFHLIWKGFIWLRKDFILLENSIFYLYPKKYSIEVQGTCRGRTHKFICNKNSYFQCSLTQIFLELFWKIGNCLKFYSEKGITLLFSHFLTEKTLAANGTLLNNILCYTKLGE